MKNDSEIPFEPHMALSLLLNTGMSKSTYIYLRKAHKERNCTLYPSYNKVLEAKKKCYPLGITFNDMKAEVPLQSLLDHTTARLLMVQEDVIRISSQHMPPSYQLIIKFGFDGNGSQSLYAMKLGNVSMNMGETNMFATFICPIKLVAMGTNNVMWQNPTPSSPVYCRPLRLQFIKETPNVIRAEYESVTGEIDVLHPYVEGNTVVHHKLILTMVDGKVCQALTNTSSSSTCYLCQPNTTPSGMNKLDRIKRKKITTEYLQFGLSPLHLLRNTMECVLHIAYRLQLKSWSVRGVRGRTVMNEENKGFRKNLKKN